jgi:hypothetical protein
MAAQAKENEENELKIKKRYENEGTSPQHNHSAPHVALPDSAEVIGSP